MSELPEEIPADGAVVFEGRNNDLEEKYELEVTLEDSDGVEIEGTKETTGVAQAQEIPSWIDCPPPPDGVSLVVWRWEGTLEPGEEYELEVAGERRPDGGDSEDVVVDVESATFVATEPVGELPVPGWNDEEVGVEMEGGDFECCECESCCGHCEMDDQQECWYVSEIGKPAVEASVEGYEDFPAHQLIYRVLDADGEAKSQHWNDLESIRVIDDDGDAAQFCAGLEVEDLASGDVETAELCLDNPGNLDVGEEALDWTWPDVCDESPPDGGDDAGVGTADAGSGTPDVGVDESGDAGGGGADVGSGAGDGGGDGGGCAAAGGGVPVPVAVVLVMVGWWCVRRGGV